MKKVLTALLLLFVIGFNCLLSACSLVTINNEKYLKETVAKIDDITITMEDLILGYNSFGYNYVQQQSMTPENAVKETLEDLIDRELLYKKAKETIGELSITKQNEIYKEVYDAINSQIKQFADEIIKNEDLILPEDSQAEEETKAEVFTPYKKKVVREKVDGQFVYRRVVEEEVETDTELIEFTLNEYGIEGLAQRAFAKYINEVQKNREEYKKLTNEEIFQKEVDRIYKIYEQNKYLTLFQQKIETEQDIDLEKIRAKYIELVKNSAFTYAIDEAGYNKKMQEASNEVYYQPFGEKFIKVAHILIQYSEEQTKEIESLKTQLKQGYIDIDEYDRLIAQKALQITTKAKEDGVEVGEAKTVNQVYSEIQASLNACGNNDDLRVETFIELIEKYNSDPGMISALNGQTQYYAINLDTTVTDTMVKEFADASRALYSSDGSTDYTLYAEPVLTEYGYHIIFSLGTVKNEITLSNIDNVTISYLYETETMQGTNKSLFDKMLELVDASNYEAYQTSIISGLRTGKTIEYNQSIYERLYK